MFLVNILFFTNILYISFCYKYIDLLVYNKKIKTLKETKKSLTKEIFKDRNTYKEQMDFIVRKQKNSNEEFIVFIWKLIFISVAMFMALHTIRIEPITINNIHLKWSIILIIIVLNMIFFKILKMVGVKY